MITAINTANRNNVQSNVNFKGFAQGKIVNVQPLKFSDHIIRALTDIPIDRADAGFLPRIECALGIPYSEISNHHKNLDTRQLQGDYLTLRASCPQADKLRMESGASSVTLNYPNGKNHRLFGFGTEIRNLLENAGIIKGEEGIFALPAKSAEFVQGEEKYDGNFRNVAYDITVKGTETRSPWFSSAAFYNVNLDKVNLGSSNIGWADKITALKSQSGSLKGNEILIEDSVSGHLIAREATIKNSRVVGDVIAPMTNASYKDHRTLKLSGQNVIDGDITAEQSFWILNAGKGRTIVRGAIGYANNKIFNAIVDGGSLTAQEIHADILTRRNGGKIRANVMDANWWENLKHSWGANRPKKDEKVFLSESSY